MCIRDSPLCTTLTPITRSGAYFTKEIIVKYIFKVHVRHFAHNTAVPQSIDNNKRGPYIVLFSFETKDTTSCNPTIIGVKQLLPDPYFPLGTLGTCLGAAGSGG